LGNAIKFTPAHGSIWVETRLAGGFVEVLVGDTGIGIGLEEQKKIFDSFYQARSAIGGTGLGLAITKHLVELHGGRIWVESTPSEGSIFHFTLPVG
jgi:signal transduction histidine kinase